MEATRRIVLAADSRSRVLVLTTFDLDEYVLEALRAGASGLLLKDAPEDRLVTAIRVVSDGGGLFAPSVTRRLVAQFVRRAPSHRTQPPGLAELTDRERRGLRLMARGMSNMEIAADLFLSEHTARTHVGHILAKLRLRDRSRPSSSPTSQE